LPVTITSSAYPQAVFSGMVGLVDPFVSESLRTVRVRVEVKNPDFQLRPGMYVDAELSVDLGESLAVPYAAVVPTGRRYLAFADKGEGRLEPRYVELGANFLIDAEAKLQGALKSW